MAFTATVMAQPTPRLNIYSCIDASGHRITADRPIPQCADREQRVLSPSGAERKRLGPALTELEMAQRLEQRRQEQLVVQRAQEQRRRDAALLARYPKRALHDAARSNALMQVEELQGLARERLEALEKEKRQLDEELLFYQQDIAKAPARLRASQEEIQKSLLAQRALLDAQTEEVLRIHRRFDSDLQRLLPLWESQAQTADNEASKSF